MDAQAELDRAPFFVKGPAKEGAEKYAREQGATEVTLVRAHVFACCMYCVHVYALQVHVLVYRTRYVIMLIWLGSELREQAGARQQWCAGRRDLVGAGVRDGG